MKEGEQERHVDLEKTMYTLFLLNRVKIPIMWFCQVNNLRLIVICVLSLFTLLYIFCPFLIRLFSPFFLSLTLKNIYLLIFSFFFSIQFVYLYSCFIYY